MADVFRNREEFLEAEPEIDVTQFRETKLDLSYADQSVNQILDIFYPDEGEGPFPVVILFHGGAFVTGHKRSHYIKSMCLPVTQGYAVATVEYRLCQEAKWPAQLIDGKAAVRYLRRHARELNLDAERFAVWGNSAGGVVTQLMAVTGDRADCDDLTTGERASSEIQCAIAWYTMSELCSAEHFGTEMTELLGYNPILYPERTCRVSPIRYVDENCPPMLLQHGTDDRVVDYHQSVYMYQKVKEVCGEDRVVLDLFDGEPHGSPEMKSDKNIGRCVDFLDECFYGGKNPYRKPFRNIRTAGEDEEMK